MGELESIRVFLKVTQQASFAGASRELGMTPASVTRTIAALEERLGVQLLVRTTRQVSLTSAGAVYILVTRPAARSVTQSISSGPQVTSQGPSSPLARTRPEKLSSASASPTPGWLASRAAAIGTQSAEPRSTPSIRRAIASSLVRAGGSKHDRGGDPLASSDQRNVASHGMFLPCAFGS
jgi:DNA-binding transcriptional LysR family regulator